MLIGTIVLACALVAAAQPNDYKRWEFFGGYSHNRFDTGVVDDDDFVDDREGYHGFNTSVTRNFSRRFGFKLDFSWYSKKKRLPFAGPFSGATLVNIDSQIYNILGGVQIKDTSSEKMFKPFAHALFGGARARNHVDFSPDVCAAFPVIFPCPSAFTDKEGGYAGAIGGGIDIRASNRVDIRIIQLDYNPTDLFNRTQHNFRIGVGIVIH